MYLLGYDIGSSSVKCSLVDALNGNCVATAFAPKSEAPIKAVNPGWAEQNPEDWWSYLKEATADVLSQSNADVNDIKAIGISYQTESPAASHYMVRLPRCRRRRDRLPGPGPFTMPYPPAQHPGQLHGLQAGMGKAERAQDI